MSNHVDFLFRLLPAWLQTVNGLKLATGFGSVLDSYWERAKSAAMCALPLFCPDDALYWHAINRGVERWPGESVASWRSRIVSAPKDMLWVGTDRGVIGALAPLGMTAVIVRDAGIAYAGGTWISSPWVHDGTSQWARQWVIVTGHPWTLEYVTRTDINAAYATAALYGATGKAAGISASLVELDVLRRIVRKWSAAVVETRVLVVMRGRVWGYPSGAFNAIYSDDDSVVLDLGEVGT